MLIKDIKDLLYEDFLFCIVHTICEGNQSDDFMAKLSVSPTMSSFFLLLLLRDLRDILEGDTS